MEDGGRRSEARARGLPGQAPLCGERLPGSAPYCCGTKYHRLRGAKLHRCTSVRGMGPLLEPPPLKLWGRIQLHIHAGGWQNATPCRFTAEDQSPWGCQPAALIPRQSTPRHLQTHSCLQSLTSSGSSQRMELTGFHSINRGGHGVIPPHGGRFWAEGRTSLGTILEVLFIRPPYFPSHSGGC